MRIGVLELQEGGSPVRWVMAEIQTFGEDAGSLVPGRFEAYARIFHPAEYNTPEERRTVR